MAGEKRRVAILGSTGSIGTQALEVIAQNPDRFEVVGLAAGSNTRLLAEQARATGAALVAVAADGGTAANPAMPALADALRTGAAAEAPRAQVLSGQSAAEDLVAASGADVVLNGMTGSIGLKPTLAALRSGATLALANKESLVVGGALVAQAQQRPGQVVPVDSEHSALAQALSSGRHEKGMCSPRITGDSDVAKLVITASGGPFRGWLPTALRDVTPEQALVHPNFSMGKVVTTNSATLVNKALEIIEAHLLFDIPLDVIEPVVHPQQIIHSLVEFHDGSTIAQAGPPRMLVPIALGLSWPERLPGVDRGVDWSQPMSWDFEPLDHTAFPAVALAKAACATSATHMAVYNAANEQAVEAFHRRELALPDILSTVETVLSEYEGSAPGSIPTVDELLDVEQWARSRADELAGSASLASAREAQR